MFALVDCNSFYASCEQIFRPDLCGKPVVVLSNNDGCIVARSKEAKALDIPAWEPFFKVKPLLEQHRVAIFSSNYELYGDISRRVMNTLSRFSPAMEVYSIDEAFIDFTGFKESSLVSIGQEIKKACWIEQRMPVCVGIASTKTLAKLANHIAKKANKLEGVCLIKDVNDWHKVLAKIPVDDVWGVGRKLGQRLKEQGIDSAEKLRQQSPTAIQKQYSIVLARTIEELNGTPCLSLETQPADKQQIFCSRSFGKKITELQSLKESIADYAARAASKLRQQQSLTSCVYVMVQTSRHKEHYYYNSSQKLLAAPSNDTRLIIETAVSLSERLYRQGDRYTKAGVGLLELSSQHHQQLDLLSPQQQQKSQVLMTVLDTINKRYGSNSIFIAQQGIQRDWQMVREYKSPAYTTRISDVPKIRI